MDSRKKMNIAKEMIHNHKANQSVESSNHRLKTACVLMSTYNGEKYLREQLDSIYSQKDVDLIVQVRDDGSTDKTLTILDEYKRKHGLQWYQGKNLGPGKSFMKLLYDAPEADYYAFADQDDVWYANKLYSAVQTIEAQANGEEPILYCCNQNCVDELRHFQHVRFPSDHREATLLPTVFANYYAGCTMVLNRRLHELVTSEIYRPDISFFEYRIHDAWVANVALAVGRIIFDPIPYMDFRRHDGVFSDEFVPNQKRNNKLRLYAHKFERFMHRGLKKNGVQKTAQQLLISYGEYYDAQLYKQIESIAIYNKSFYSRIKFIHDGIIEKAVCQNKEILYYKVLIGVL